MQPIFLKKKKKKIEIIFFRFFFWGPIPIINKIMNIEFDNRPRPIIGRTLLYRQRGQANEIGCHLVAIDMNVIITFIDGKTEK